MKAQFLHLSGPHRGMTVTYDAERVIVGSGPRADVAFPEEAAVAPRHAEVRYVKERCAFFLRRLEGRVFVNSHEVEEIILAHDDLVEFGVDGPQARFRVYTRPGSVCKPVRLMLSDAREIGRRGGGLRAATRTFTRDLFTQASLRLKIGLPAGVAVLAVATSYVSSLMVTHDPDAELRRAFERQCEEHRIEIEKLRGVFAEAESRRQALASKEDVAAIRKDFAERSELVDKLAASNRALTRVLEEYSKGVCLIHGVFAFRSKDPQGPPFLTDASGKRFEREYVGSGFLATATGDVVTNRHVAEPWWKDEEAQQAVNLGFKPEFLRFEAIFPDQPPVGIDPASVILRRGDDIDVAVLRVDVRNVPVLPLSTAEPRRQRGRRVVVLGYPTGISALLAKTEPPVFEEVTNKATDLTTLIALLAEKRAVSPLATQGALSEVLEKRLVYDANTTSGGSGGPVFGEDGDVIGVNFAVLQRFTGSNFGVPIRFARDLIAAAASRPN